MKYEIVELEEKVIVGIRIKTTNQDGKSMQDIGITWQEIWNMNLKRKYSCDFEEYQNNSENMQKQEIHIYIALDE